MPRPTAEVNWGTRPSSVSLPLRVVQSGREVYVYLKTDDNNFEELETLCQVAVAQGDTEKVRELIERLKNVDLKKRQQFETAKIKIEKVSTRIKEAQDLIEKNCHYTKAKKEL